MKIGNHTYSNRSKGFTLVETLIVVGIIATLSAATFGVTRSVQNAAKKISTERSIREVMNAVERYHAEYRKHPVDEGVANVVGVLGLGWDANVVSGAVFLRELAGEVTGLPVVTNYKQINFFAATTSQKISNNAGAQVRADGLSRTNAGGIVALQDPWGKAMRVKLDWDYDGIITPPTNYRGFPNIGNEDVRAKCLVFSEGPDQVLYTADDIVSWR